MGHRLAQGSPRGSQQERWQPAEPASGTPQGSSLSKAGKETGLFQQAQEPPSTSAPETDAFSEAFLSLSLSTSCSHPSLAILSLHSKPTGPQSGPSRRPEAIPGLLRASRPDSLQGRGELRLSNMTAALALPASSSRVKGHQASALRPLAVRPFLYPSPQHLWPRASQSTLPPGVSLEKEQPGDGGGKGQCEEGQAGAEARMVVPRLGSLGLLCSGPWGEARVIVAWPGQARGQSGLMWTGKGWSQSKRGKGLIKCPDGLGSTLAGVCFSCSRRGHLGLPPATHSPVHLSTEKHSGP